MSLKAFHIFFISVCILATLGFSYWAQKNLSVTNDPTFIYYIIFSWVVIGGLIFYGYNFLKKIK